MRPSAWFWPPLAIALLFALVGGGCSRVANLPGGIFPGADTSVLVENTATHTPTPFQPLPPTAVPATFSSSSGLQPETTHQPEETPIQPGYVALWAAPYLPDGLQQALILPHGVGLASRPEDADLRLVVGDQSPITRWVYALVAPFPTIADGVTFNQIQRAWAGERAGPFAGLPILMDEHTHQVFEAFWGPTSSGAVSILPADKLLNQAWKNRPSWAIIPFEALRPRWKVLEIDGQSPVRVDFNPASYPLVVPFSLVGNQDEDGIREQVAQGLPATNRDSHKLTTVILTGVTAMVRATAYLMERDGITNPAQDIGEWLRSADITHISNEIPFAASCPFPDPQQADLRFCSSPRYIGLLEDIGTDIVELTGDHFADWGSDATLYTLEMYRDRGWLYYGGGENLAEGRKAVRLDHNGNRIAFIGCNAKGGGYSTASETRPGAVPCDFNWMGGEIRRLKEKGVLVIATFQHQEIYSYSVSPGVREDFVRLAEAGADIVSGSQAHQPQGMEFVDGSFLHFGLGNLFFDQYRYFAGPETDQAFIDRHVFYDGRYIATELLTTQFVNLARSRPMTPEEREEFLSRIFTASGW